jgi:SAM-dependent methyltransferase
MGDEFFTKIAGKVVIDFGCGEGAEAVEMAGGGAKQVIGIDIREDLLKAARQRAVSTGVQNSCHFVSSTKELADIVVSLDTFEDFADPAGILRIINTLLPRQARCSSASGQHGITHLAVICSPFFPWAHLIFREKALIRWRSTFRLFAERFSMARASGSREMRRVFCCFFHSSALDRCSAL